MIAKGTMREGLRKPAELMVVLITLLTSGCSPQPIAHVYDLDERTGARSSRPPQSGPLPGQWNSRQRTAHDGGDGSLDATLHAVTG